jgi:hypothetical protein
MWSLAAANDAFAYPEFVRTGYFSCTSCHVSPGGGGQLTDYGRGFSSEKLATWSYEGEEKPLYGVGPNLPEWLLLQYESRQIQTFVDTKTVHEGRWIPMQRDLMMCLHGGPAWLCGTAGITESQSESDDGKLHFGLRAAQARFDIGENFIARVGRFFPRYGLMIANHTASIRKGIGMDANSEDDQIEGTFTSEKVEVSLAREMGRIFRMGGDKEEEADAYRRGWVSTAMLSVGTKSRVGVSYRRQDLKDARAHTAGAFAGVGVTDASYVLAEYDQRAIVSDEPAPGDPKITRKGVSYVKAGYELVRGVVPYLQHETDFADLRDGDTRTDTYGYGVQWYPRPHLEVDGFWSHILSRRDFSYSTAGYLLLHFYL